MSAALALVACDKDNYNYSGLKEGYGLLSFADAGFVVSEETNTRATEPASDNTVIWVYNVNEDGTVNMDEPVDLDPIKDVTYTTYGAVKTNGITLPGGNYVLRAQTKDVIPMVGAGDAAVYGIDQPFSITAGQTKELETLTLYLYKQVKVSVSYNEAFQKSLTENGGTTTVTLDGEHFATFNVTPTDFDSDSQYLYIDLTNEAKEVQEAGVSMEISVNAEMYVKEDGVTSVKTQKMTAAVTGVKPRDYRKIQIHKEEIKDGGANFSIVVDGLQVDTELSTDISASEGSLGDDPNAPKGDGGIKLINTAGLTGNNQTEWNAYVAQTEEAIANNVMISGVHKDAITVNGLTALTFSAEVPNGVYNFYVDITSTNPDFEEAVAFITVDKNNPQRIYLTKTESEHRGVVAGLDGIGISFPYPEDVINKTQVSFPLTAAIDKLSGFKGTHYFTMNVIDNTGCKNTIVLTLKVE